MHDWKRQSMGLGTLCYPLGTLCYPDTVFARKFRWILTNDNIPDLEYLPKNLQIDFVNKIIKFEAMIVYFKDQDTKLDEWLLGLKKNKDIVVLTTFDGCGHALDRYKFYINEVKEQSMDLDYASSEVACMKISLSFSEYQREVCIGDKTIVIKDFIKIQPRGNLKAEEARIHHLNASFTIPGRLYINRNARMQQIEKHKSQK